MGEYVPKVVKGSPLGFDERGVLDRFIFVGLKCVGRVP